MSAERTPAWVWLGALAPRFAVLAAAFADPARCVRGDSEAYLSLADGLLSQHAFLSSVVPGTAETLRTPGYPLFLAAVQAVFGPPALPAAALQCLLGAWTAVIVWRWARELGGARGAAAGWAAVAFDAATVLHTPLIIAEAPFLFALVLAARAVWRALPSGDAGRWPDAVLAGLLWGVAAMLRPIVVYLPVPLAVAWRRDRKALAAFLAAAYLLPAAWTARNYSATRLPVFASIGGEVLLRYPAAGVESLRTGRPWQEVEQELRAQVDAAHPAGYASDAARSAAYGAAAAPLMKAHPVLLFQYAAWGAVKLLGGAGLELVVEWFSTDTPEPGDKQFQAAVTGQGTRNLLRRHPWLIPIQALYLAGLAALYLLTPWGLYRLWSSGRKEQALFLGGCLLYITILSSSQGYYRYRLPMMPFFGLAAAAALFPRKA